MQDVDFLPVRYRQRRLRRRWQPWRVVVVFVFVVLAATAALSQQGRKRRAEHELAAIGPQYEMAVSQNRRLTEIQTRLAAAREDAELLTYLRHPWPRTQLLAALLTPLPEEITLERLQITHELRQDHVPRQRYRRSETGRQDGETEKLPPAACDLKRLREQFDEQKTFVLISGTASESAAVHRYLGDLGRSSLFIEADLESLESAEQDPTKRLQFDAALVVRPGYGQPGGPTDPQKSALARTDHPNR